MPAAGAAELHYEVRGTGPPVVLVHGGVTDGRLTWPEQAPLADRWRLVVVDRPGYGRAPDAAREDFEVDAGLVAELLDERPHLVGHSYGGVVCLLAAALRPDRVRSLTVIEPPAFAVARGDADADALVEDLKGLWRDGPREDPEAYLRSFLALVGSSVEPPSPLPPPLARGARMLTLSRGPWEAEPPLEALARAPFPKLVVSGGHSPAFDAVCDVLERELEAERAVIGGEGHSAQRTRALFNDRLEAFLREAA